MASYPDAPKYDKETDLREQQRINQAAANQQYANLVSDLGGYSVSVDPNTGKTTINKNLGDNSKLSMRLQQEALNAYNADPEAQRQQYYDAQMNYIQPYLDNQRANVMKDLEDKGIPIGSKAYNNVMANLDENQNNLTNLLSAEALYNGQDYNMGLLDQSTALGSQVYDPQMIQGIGAAGLSNTALDEFNNAKAMYATDVAKANARMQALGNLANIAFNMIGNYGGSTSGGGTGGGTGSSSGGSK